MIWVSLANIIHRSDYEDFIRNFAKQITDRLPLRIDNYMASLIQVSISYIYLMLHVR